MVFPHLLPAPIEIREDGLPQYTFAWCVLFSLLQINLYWPLLNLLPIFPLDGGQIAREICQAVSPGGGTAFSLGLSMVTAAVLAVHMLLGDRSPIPYLPRGGTYGAVLFAYLGVSSFQALVIENERRRRWHTDDDLPWER
jgi:Zn-dependent protease